MSAPRAEGSYSGCESGQSILLVSDMAGYGKVALSVAIPILSHMKLNVYNLPTALVSNTLDYGKFDILDTTSYMRNTLNVWDELGFSFDAIATGFLVSEEQSLLVSDYCSRRSAQGVPIFVDPIMGDDGKLYNGVTEKSVDHMRHMCGVADIIMPNMTEAEFLTGICEGKESVSRKEASAMVARLHEMGSKIVVITSLSMDGSYYTLVSTPQTMAKGYDQFEVIPYERIPISMPGTGDIFSSILIGSYMQAMPIMDCVRRAMAMVVNALGRCQNSSDIYRGVPIELHLDLIGELSLTPSEGIDGL